MKIISPCYSPDTQYAKPLIESLLYSHSYVYRDLLFYGVGEAFTDFYDTKMAAVAKVLETIDDEIVLLCDSFDVIVNKDLEGLEEAFKEFKCKLLISAEANCFPSRLHESFLASKSNTILKFPCAGCWIGYKDYLLELFTSSLAIDNELLWRQTTDQGFLQESYYRSLLEENNEIKIDFNAKIFVNTFLLEQDRDFTIENGTFIFNETQNVPYFVHFNGDGKIHMPLFGYRYMQ